MPADEVGAKLKLSGRREFVADAEAAERSVRDIGDAAEKADRKASRLGSGGLAVARTGIGALTQAAKLGAVAVGALSVGVGALAVKTVGLASDAAETGSKFETVFGGDNTVTSWVQETNAAFGITTKELQDAAAGFGVFAKAAGLPTDQVGEFASSIAQAGLDLSSFYNVDPQEAFTALQSGLAGETEAMRRYGVFMSDAALEAFAAAEGYKTAWKDMGEGEKVAVRQAFILANLGDAHGDLARTSDSLANQQRALKGRLTEAGTAIGTALLPYVTAAAVELNERLAPAVSWLQTNAGPIVEGFAADAGDALDGLRLRFELASMMWERSGSIGETIALFVGFEGAAAPVDRLVDAAGDLWKILDVALIPAFLDVYDALPPLVSPLGQIESGLDFLSDNAETLRPIVTGLVAAFVAYRTALFAANAVLKTQTALTKTQTFFSKAHLAQTKIVKAATVLWTGAQWLLNAALSANPIGLVVLGIAALVAAFVLAWKHSETFRNIVLGVWEKVKGAARAFASAVGEKLGEIGRKAGEVKDSIVQKWDSFVAYVRGLPAKIRAAASGMWNGVKDSFRSAVNWIIGKWNGLEFTIGGGSFLGRDIPSLTLGTPNIPRLHSGGTTTSGGVVNIRPDEELVVLPSAATVVPLPPDGGSELPALMGALNDRPIVVQLVTPNGDVLAEQTVRGLQRKLARQ